MTEENQKPIPRIRTFETDIETRKKMGISPADVVAKFGAINGAEKINIKKIIIIAVLILAGGELTFGIFKIFSKEKPPEEEKPPATQIGKPYIKADLEKTLSFSPADPGSLISAVKKELETQRKSESALFLELSQTLKEFSQFTGLRIPESLTQNSSPSFNIFTAYHTGSSSLVFLIKIENFEKAYGSLLSWEKDMWQSFGQFLNADDIKNISKFSFGDEIIRNHDSRVLKNLDPPAGGKSILAYAIFNKQFVIISTSREGLGMMLQRLIASPPPK